MTHTPFEITWSRCPQIGWLTAMPGQLALARAIALPVRLVALAVLTLSLLPLPAEAEEDIEVDLQLILAVDVSLSMDTEEQRLQRDGYVSALRHPDVISAIRDGPHGRIALTYMEWAGSATQEVLVPWSLIDGRETAQDFAEKLASFPLRRAHRTSISGALQVAGMLFEGSGFRGLRRIVDISGDGANNQGEPVTEARDQLIEQGIVINGLAIMITRDGADEFFHLANLDDYFEDCVVGGPGAFVMRVTEENQFASAIRRKMILEIADAEPRIDPAAARGSGELVDCLIGEKRWQRWRELRE